MNDVLEDWGFSGFVVSGAMASLIFIKPQASINTGGSRP
jgi:hypothetical protein